MEMDPKKVAVIIAWPIPQHSTFNWIDIRKDTVSMEKSQHESFQATKKVVATGPMLRIVDPLKPFFLETDESGIVVGVVFL